MNDDQIRNLKPGQQVFLASARLLDGGDMSTLPFLVLPANVKKAFPSPTAPTIYVETFTAERIKSGPWMAQEVFETEREALIAGVKLATGLIDTINREAAQRTTSILRTITNFAPAIISKVSETPALFDDAVAALRETRPEISRVNKAAGETIFNPAATQMIDAVLAKVQA